MINNVDISGECSPITNQNQTTKQPAKGRWTQLARLALVGLAASSLTGCVGRFTGGGSIDSVAGAPQKATFGFVINATDPDENGNPTNITGQFQFNDHGAGVSFHVAQLRPTTPPGVGGILFDDQDNPVALATVFEGTYSCNAGTGEVWIGAGSEDQVYSNPFVTATNKDAIDVEVLTGPYAGYSNAGLVQHGEVSFFPAK